MGKNTLEGVFVLGKGQHKWSLTLFSIMTLLDKITLKKGGQNDAKVNYKLLLFVILISGFHIWNIVFK